MTTVTLPPQWLSACRYEAHKRMQLHQNHASSRPLSTDYEAIGLYGEAAFCLEFGMPLTWEERPEGDGGVDFIIDGHTIDVKTARKPFNLICEEGKATADVVVLAGWNEPNTVTFVGWERGRAVTRAPTRDFGYGVTNHYIAAPELKPMHLLAIAIENAKDRASEGATV